MIAFGEKRIFGLIGAPRSGKDSVANYLIETRGFVSLAFADQIKEEFGISKEEFEAAKIAGNIEELRKKLWDFSAKIREKDPLHFINNVLEKAENLPQSAVITDIRTKDELEQFVHAIRSKRIYFVVRNNLKYENNLLVGSELSAEMIENKIYSDDVRVINNTAEGLYYFQRDLDKFFFLEDVRDVLDSQDYNNSEDMIKYLAQYDVQEARKA